MKLECHNIDLPGKIYNRHKRYKNNHHFLLWSKAVPKKTIHVWNCKPSQKAMAQDIISPRSKAGIILLSGHADKLLSKYSCLQPQIGASLNLGQRSFILKRAIVNEETQDCQNTVTTCLLSVQSYMKHKLWYPCLPISHKRHWKVYKSLWTGRSAMKYWFPDITELHHPRIQF